jgi:glutaredoxin
MQIFREDYDLIQVKLYTISTCPHCRAVREFLKRNDVEFDEYNVDEDEERWKEALSKTGGLDIVPVVDIDGQAVFAPLLESWR